MKNKRYFNNRFKISLVISGILLLFLILGIFGIPPFGWYEFIGDVMLPRPTILGDFPIRALYPLIERADANGLFPNLAFIIIFVLIYYFLFSRLLVFIWDFLKKRVRIE